MASFKKGLEVSRPDISYLKGKIDGETLCDALGIEIAHFKGNEIVCHCPDLMGNHSNGDANPSFSLNLEKMVYNCYVCGGSKYLIDLVNQIKGTSDVEAEQFLVSIASLDEANPDGLLKRVQEILFPEKEDEILSDYPLDCLFRYRKIHPWLYERGLSKEVIIEMQVGYDEEHGGIVIPHMYMGKLVGWQTRHLVMDEKGYVCPRCSETKKVVPKYTNTSSFPKKTTLYNYDNILGCGYDTIIVVESPMTALYLKSNGYLNVVAHFGSPISEEQCNLLVRFPKIIYWSDADIPKQNPDGTWTRPAGIHSTNKIIKYLSKYTILEIAPVPDVPKGDAADIPARCLNYFLGQSYPAMLFPLYGQVKLPIPKE